MELTPREAKNRNSKIVFKGWLWTVGTKDGKERDEAGNKIFSSKALFLLCDLLRSTNNILMKAA